MEASKKIGFDASISINEIIDAFEFRGSLLSIKFFTEL